MSSINVKDGSVYIASLGDELGNEPIGSIIAEVPPENDDVDDLPEAQLPPTRYQLGLAFIKKHPTSLCGAFLTFLTLTIVLVLTYANSEACPLNAGEYHFRCVGDKQFPKYTSDGKRIHRVCFIGDSLVSLSNAAYRLVPKVINRLRQTYNNSIFDAVEAGISGDMIEKIKARLAKSCLTFNPDSIVLYWDSDAVDHPSAATSEYQRSYRTTLRSVLSTMNDATPNHVIVAGPTLWGEMGRGMNAKDTTLDTYESMNRNIASEYPGCSFVSTRSAFFSELSRHPTVPLTDDGEHHSEAGVNIVADLFYTALVEKYAGELASENPHLR